jgi:hypothetical protein
VNKYQIGLAAAAALAIGFAGTASAATVDSISKGAVFVSNEGGPAANGQIQNIITLAYGNLGNQSAFLVFDPSSLSGLDIASGKLTITGAGSYAATPGSNTVNLYDFGGSITAAQLMSYGRQGSYDASHPAPSAADAAALRDDLRSGVIYGSATVPASGDLTFELNAAAIAALNQAIDTNSLFVLGIWSPTQTGGYMFLSSGGAVGHLDATPTPLPAALPLFGSILAGGGLVAWRRKRKAAKVAA